MAYLSALCRFSGLLRSFLGIQHRSALVLSALGAGAMGKLLLMAVRALRKAGLSQEVVGTAVGAAARRVAPFRIRHDALPFAFSPVRTSFDPVCVSAGRNTSKFNVLLTLSCCATRKAPPSGGRWDPLRTDKAGDCGLRRSAGKVLCNQACRGF